jgi:hypothetical protein
MTNSTPPTLQIQFWPIDKFVLYTRNPRKNDAAVDRMVASLQEFGFAIPVLARSSGEVIDGHLRLKGALKMGSWPGGDTTRIPVIPCDGWTDAQVKAFRLLVNRSVSWADWDEELLSVELQELAVADFDLSLTGFDPRELEDLLTLPNNDEQADVAPLLPENPVSRSGDLWVCGNRRNQHRKSTSEKPSGDVYRRHLIDYLNQVFAKHPDWNKTIEAIIISHPHKDHTMFLMDVMNNFTVHTLIDNGAECGSGIDDLKKARAFATTKQINYLAFRDKNIHADGLGVHLLPGESAAWRDTLNGNHLQTGAAHDDVSARLRPARSRGVVEPCVRRRIHREWILERSGGLRSSGAV